MTATQQVQTVLNGTSGTVNVTVANLIADVNAKDFIVIVGGVVVPNTNYTKTTSTTITYSGPALVNQNTIIRRKTPAVLLNPVNYSTRIVSSDWLNELDRIYRRLNEVEMFGFNYLSGL